jgi:hypothetical protein
MTLRFDTCLLTYTAIGIVLGCNALSLFTIVIIVLIWRKKSVKQIRDEEGTEQDTTASHHADQISASDSFLRFGAVNTSGGVAVSHNLHRRTCTSLSQLRDARVEPWSPYDVGTCDASALRHWLSQQGTFYFSGSAGTLADSRCRAKSSFHGFWC